MTSKDHLSPTISKVFTNGQFIVVIASLNLVMDFDFIEQGAAFFKKFFE